MSRNFDLYFVRPTASSVRLPFKVIASDSGLLEHPVQTTDLIVSVAERYEVIFDFSAYAGQTIELRNIVDAKGIGVDEEYDNTNKVMKFVVSSSPVADTSTVPANLRTVPFPRRRVASIITSASIAPIRNGSSTASVSLTQPIVFSRMSPVAKSRSGNLRTRLEVGPIPFTSTLSTSKSSRDPDVAWSRMKLLV